MVSRESLTRASVPTGWTGLPCSWWHWWTGPSVAGCWTPSIVIASDTRTSFALEIGFKFQKSGNCNGNEGGEDCLLSDEGNCKVGQNSEGTHFHLCCHQQRQDLLQDLLLSSSCKVTKYIKFFIMIYCRFQKTRQPSTLHMLIKFLIKISNVYRLRIHFRQFIRSLILRMIYLLFVYFYVCSLIVRLLVVNLLFN